MSVLTDDTTPVEQATSPAFTELRSNLQYARGLVTAGRSLARLQVGAFDVTDLFRAAWVQAVSALDHWVHRELYDRAVALAVQTSEQRPRNFLRITVPMSFVENVYHGSADLRETFREHLRSQFGHLSFQQPDKIKAALDMVTDKLGWPDVASRIVVADEQIDSSAVKNRLTEIARRRNKIAHETDREPQTGRRSPLTAEETTEAIDWVERIAAAVLEVIGPVPEEPDLLAPARPATKARWQRGDVDSAASAAGAEIDAVVRRLLGHAERCGARFNGGTGVAPSAGLYYPTRKGPRSLWSLFMTPDRPSISVNLAIVNSVDETVARRLIEDLRRIPQVDDALVNDDDDLLRRYPTVHLSAFTAAGAAVDDLVSAFDRVVEAWS